MGLFDRFRRKPQGSWMAVRTAAVAEKFPALLDPDTVGSSRAELQRCSACGGLTEDVVITTGGPLGDPELWRRHPVALDACRCKECGQVSYPIALEPAEIKALLDAGAAAAQSGNLDDADLFFRRAANGRGDRGLPRMNLGSVYLDRARAIPADEAHQVERLALARTAVALFRQSLACHHPAPVPARFLLGRTLVLLGELAEGQRELRAMLADPDAPAAMRADARDLLTRRDWELTQAQARAYEEGVNQLAIERFLQGRAPTSESERAELRAGMARLDELLAERPEHWPSWWVTGLAARALRQLDEAYDRFHKAYLLAPDETDVVREYGGACMALGKGAEAVAAARKALLIEPADAGLQANLALALLIAGEVADAEQTAAAALLRAPDDVITQNLLSFIREVLAGRRERPTAWGPGRT